MIIFSMDFTTIVFDCVDIDKRCCFVVISRTTIGGGYCQNNVDNLILLLLFISACILDTTFCSARFNLSFFALGPASTDS